MRFVLALMVMATALFAQQPAHPVQAKPKSGAPPAARTGVKPAASTKAAAPKAHSTVSHAQRRLVNGRWVTASRHPARSRQPVGQQHPEPNRYQEIQKALHDRGYLKGEPAGEWNDNATDALKRFQADQKLPNDGKISALTLIGLGLGPKHEGGPVVAPPPSSLPPATTPPISPGTVPPPNRPQ
jgi:hypothetical protein